MIGKTDKIFIALLRVSGVHAAASREHFARMNLTEGQPKVLYILRRNEGILQKELASLCNVSQPTLTVLLDKMMKRGFIKKEVCSVSGGKRGYQVFLTESGKEKAEELENVVEELEAKSMKGLSEEEVDLLLTLLAKVQENLIIG